MNYKDIITIEPGKRGARWVSTGFVLGGLGESAKKRGDYMESTPGGDGLRTLSARKQNDALSLGHGTDGMASPIPPRF